ncbi:MAG: cupin domain-containing protein, partial [Gemmatimonadales bacterium]
HRRAYPESTTLQELPVRRIYPIAVLALLAIRTAPAQAPALNWGPAPAIFPAGAKMAVLQGDPGKAALFTVRLDLPSGYTIAPHTHPTDEGITVIQGTFLLGMGDKVDAAHATKLPAGGFTTIDANMHHYAVAQGRTIVQVHSMGPFALVYVNPADDPTRKTKASDGARK